MTSHDSKQLTANDIKGDLAQRLRCPGCSRNFAMVEGRNIVTLDRKETVDTNRRAISIVCDDCKKDNKQPVFAFRKFIASDGSTLVLEARVEDLPDLAPSSGVTKSTTKRGSRRSTRGSRTKTGSERKTTPVETTETASEGAKKAAEASVATVE